MVYGQQIDIAYMRRRRITRMDARGLIIARRKSGTGASTNEESTGAFSFVT
jgi:hypothetical protein